MFAQPARLDVLRRARDLMRNGSRDAFATLYLPCQRYLAHKRDRNVNKSLTRKLEAVGLEQLWHVLLGMPNTLSLAQAPCASQGQHPTWQGGFAVDREG